MLLSCCGMATLSRGFLHGLAGEKAQPFVHPLEAELDCCSHQGPCSPLLSFHTRELMLSCNVSNLLERIIQLPGVLNSRFMHIAYKFLWGIWLLSSQIYIFFQILFNNGRKGGPTKMERKYCSRKAWTRISPLAFPNQDCIEVHVEGPARLSQALTLFIAHISTTSQFNPLGNAQILLCCKESNPVRVFICWNFPKLWELQPFTFTLGEDG